MSPDGVLLDATEASPAMPARITKRDGREVVFDPDRIARAISLCFGALGRAPATSVDVLTQRSINLVSARTTGGTPTVELVQDAVEMVLQAAGEFAAAKHYILYRAAHARERAARPVPDDVRAAFDASAAYFPTALQQFQFYDKYSRYDHTLGRRETWVETVDRAVAYLHELAGDRLGAEIYARIRQAILTLQVMPSMRLLAMAGPAARRNNLTIYNCSALPIEDLDAFPEALMISMAGCGVGYSVERQFVDKLPRVARQRSLAPARLVVEDSTEGWADALRAGVRAWADGGDVTFDLSQIRPSGAPLRTKGGRASGPEPLRAMLDFVRARMLARQGSFLRPIDAHDMMCAVGNAAVSGGVRRCLPAGTRIHLERGAVPIEDVREGDRVMTATGYESITGWVDQGVQPVVEILTESGTVFRCTPHHRVAVLADVWGGHEFKYARDLTPDDRLLFITHAIDGEDQPLLPLPEKRESDHSGSAIRQPDLTTETAWVLGKFFADGYVQVTDHDERGKGGNTQFAVACHSREIDQIERVSAWMEDHGITARIVGQDGNLVQVRSGNRQIARWMLQYKQPNTPLTVPDEIWRGLREVRAAFLAGLMDGDGCYTDRPITVVATGYEGFGRQVVRLLATLGIIAEIRMRCPENEQGWRAQWVVSVKDAIAIQNAAEIIGSHACGVWAPRKGKQAGYTVPGWMVKRDVPYRVYGPVWSSSRDDAMNSATLTTLVDATHYVPVQVVEVRPGGDAHTYDIEVRDGSMFVAEGYLVHNTAMLSLFDDDDDEMRLCKSGDFERENSQRWNANNSAVWPDGGLTQESFAAQFLEMIQSHRGEPGIFNRAAIRATRPARRKDAMFLVNPCVTGDTWVMTDQGARQVSDLIGVPHVALVDGQRHETTAHGFWETGVRPVLRLQTNEGYALRLTDNHPVLVVRELGRLTERTEWVEAGQLQPGDRVKLHNHRETAWDGYGAEDDGWLLGSLVGDGTFVHYTTLAFWGEHRHYMAKQAVSMLRRAVSTRSDLQRHEKDAEGRILVQSAGLTHLAADYGIYRGHKTITPVVEGASSLFCCGFLRGLFDADGTVIGTLEKGLSVRLSQSNLPLLEAAQRMLLRLGIAAQIYRERRGEGVRMMPDGHGGLAAYLTQANHELVIANDNLQVFAEQIGFSDPDKAERLSTRLSMYRRTPNRERFIATVVALDPDGVEPVYDCSVPGVNAFDANGLYVHNCGEAVLRPYGLCNLSAAVARAEDTPETLRDKVELATIVGTIQGLATHFPGMRPQWAENARDERLLGVDITGQLDSPVAQDALVKAQLRAHAEQVNRQAAQALGINPSTQLTVVKPSGNTSQLVDCASGLHARWAPYYVRNVRVAASSPLYHVLRDAGVPMSPENGQQAETATTWVIHFPVKSPDGAITRTGRSAVAQCDFWLQNKTHWTEGNPSATITYQPDEILDVMRWVWEHRNQVGGLSFLPAFDAQYDNMPYVEITREEYEARAAAFPQIDFARVYRYEERDLTTAAQEVACAGGACDWNPA